MMDNLSVLTVSLMCAIFTCENARATRLCHAPLRDKEKIASKEADTKGSIESIGNGILYRKLAHCSIKDLFSTFRDWNNKYEKNCRQFYQ